MSHIVSGKLRKAPFIKDGCGQDGQSRMYAIELSEVNKDFKTGEKVYTNYRAAFFAKTDNAKAYYDKAFAEGSFVVVYGEKLKIEQREHNGKNYVSLSIENARLEGANFEEGNRSQQQTQQFSGAQQQSTQQRSTDPSMEFDDDIPFASFGLQYGKHRIYAI